MRRAALIASAALLAAGCGTTEHAATTTPPKPTRAPAARLQVGVAGPLRIALPGIRVRRGLLATLPAYPLVLASARTNTVEAVRSAAAAAPTSHYAYVGGSVADAPRTPNLVGVVLRDEQAALLAGVVAGLVLDDQGSPEGRAAYVGPQENRLANAFTDGVHQIVPAATVLHAWSKRSPARCKEAALSTFARGAVVVLAHEGLCAQGAAAAAHQQNHSALAVTDFELPSVAASVVVRDAVSGVYHGGEDLVFGAASGAIGVRRLDPRISADVQLRARAAAQQLASGIQPTG